MVKGALKRAPVKEPKNWGVPGRNVLNSAPKNSGTIIIPPGIRSMVRLIGSWIMGPPRRSRARWSAAGVILQHRPRLPRRQGELEGQSTDGAGGATVALRCEGVRGSRGCAARGPDRVGTTPAHCLLRGGIHEPP